MNTNNSTVANEDQLDQLLSAFCDNSLLQVSEMADDCIELVNIAHSSSIPKEAVSKSLKWFYEIYHYLQTKEIKSGYVPFIYCELWYNSSLPSKLNTPNSLRLADFISLSGQSKDNKLKALLYNSLQLYDELKVDASLWEMKPCYSKKDQQGPLQNHIQWTLKPEYTKTLDVSMHRFLPAAKAILDDAGLENFDKIIKNVSKFRLLEETVINSNFKNALSQSDELEEKNRPQISTSVWKFWNSQAQSKRYLDSQEVRKVKRHEVWHQYKPLDTLLEGKRRKLGGEEQVYVIETTTSQGPAYVTVGTLLSAYDKLVVPIYQRHYEWEDKELRDMFADLSDLELKGETLPLFLGTILLQCGSAGSQEMEVLDGQQRLLTFYLICAWACKLLTANGEDNKAEVIAKKYIAVVDEPTEGKEIYTPRFTPDARDQNALKEILSSCIAADWDFDSWGTVSGEEGTGAAVKKQFKNIELIFGPSYHNVGLIIDIKPLCEMLIKLFQVCYVCRFVLNERDDPFDTFKRLNHFGKPLHNSDLLKSAILKHVEKAELKNFHDKYWMPFAERIGEKGKKNGNVDKYRRTQLDKFFTCFAKIKNHGSSNKQTVYTLTDYWSKKTSADQIIQELNEVAEVWKLLNEPTPSHILQSMKQFGSNITTAVLTLGFLAPPVEFVPFVLAMLDGLVNNKCAEENVLGSIQLLSSWLIRHNLITDGATTLHGLHSVFSAETYTNLTESGFDSGMLFEKIDRVEFAVNKLTDARFKDKLLITKIGAPSFKKRKALVFAIDTSDSEHGFGAKLTSKNNNRIEAYAKFSVEHVAPQNPGDDGWTHMSDHQDLIHLLGNLVGLSIPDNAAMSNGPFESKLNYILEHSEFISAKKLQNVTADPSWTTDFSSLWGAEIIEDRTKKMSDLLVRLFPFPAEDSAYNVG